LGVARGALFGAGRTFGLEGAGRFGSFFLVEGVDGRAAEPDPERVLS
jgi:hypothetical protein